MSGVDFYLTFYRFTVRTHLSLSYRKNLSRLNSCSAFHLLASHVTSELHASLCLRRCSVSTQPSVLPMLNLAQLYSILLPWATGHILHNAGLCSLCTCYTLMDNSCRIFKMTCWRRVTWRQQNTGPQFVEESVQPVALKTTIMMLISNREALQYLCQGCTILKICLFNHRKWSEKFKSLSGSRTASR